MTRVADLLRGLATAVLGALLGAACLVMAYALSPGLDITLDIDPPPVVSGLYPIERAPDGLTFAWSHDVVRLYLPGLDRQHPWELRLRFSSPRPDPGQQPDVTIDVDGVVLKQVRGTQDFQDVAVTLPTGAGDKRGALIVIRSSNTFVPGPEDRRALALTFDEIRLVPPAHGWPIVPRQVIASAALGGAIFGALFGLIGLTAGSAALAVVALGCGQAAVLSDGAAPYTRYAAISPTIAAWVAIGTIIIVWIVERVRSQRLRNTARFVAAFSSAALFLKLLVLFHPGMPVGDALFQAHRFEWVRDGRWFFTSIAPGGYEFPYAIGLYVSTLPFDGLVNGTYGFMALLRVLVAAMDTAAGVLLYPMIVRGVDRGAQEGRQREGRHSVSERLAGAMAVGLYHLLPLNFQVQWVGNLTNAFGQALFVFTLALLVLTPAGRSWRYVGWTGLFVFAAGAMLSHTSTFAIAVPVLLLAAVLFRMSRVADVVARARPAFVISVAAAVVAVATYYGHFGETYAAQFARIGEELGKPAAASDPGGRSIAQRAAMVPYYLNEYYGWPALVLAGIGAGALAGRRDVLTLTVWAWVGGTFAFLVLGVLTPLDFRHYLAAYPAIAILAGCGAARWWTRGPFLQAAAIVLIGASLIIGVRHWLAPLG